MVAESFAYTYIHRVPDFSRWSLGDELLLRAHATKIIVLSAVFVAEGAFLAISPFEAMFQSDKRYPHKINKFVVEGNLQITVAI